MKKTRAISGQSLLDIALQEYGTADRAFDMAAANDMMVTDSLSPGAVLHLPDFEDKPDVVRYYKSKRIKPATARPLLQDGDLEEWFGGLPGMLPLMLS